MESKQFPKTSLQQAKQKEEKVEKVLEKFEKLEIDDNEEILYTDTNTKITRLKAPKTNLLSSRKMIVSPSIDSKFSPSVSLRESPVIKLRSKPWLIEFNSMNMDNKDKQKQDKIDFLKRFKKKTLMSSNKNIQINPFLFFFHFF